MAQAREPRTKVIQPYPHAGTVQLLQQRHGEYLVTDDSGFGQLQMQPRSRQPRGVQAGFNLANQVAVAQLARRDVDRNEHCLACRIARPAHGLLAGRMQHLRANHLDQATLFGNINEHRRWDRAQRRVIPAQQHFRAHQHVVAGAEDGLVHQPQLVTIPRATQLLLQVQTPLHRVIHGPVVVTETVLAGQLGLVHGNVAVLQQHRRPVRILGEQGDADGTAQEYLALLHLQRLPQLHHQTLGQLCRHFRRAALTLADQDDEFITPKARQQGIAATDLAHRRGDALGELQQGVIARFVAKRVVDPLEFVDIDKQQSQGTPGQACLMQPPIQCLTECQAVGQPGQGVGIGHLPHFAIMPGDALAHPIEAAQQLADFITAPGRLLLDLVVAALDALCRIAQPADRPHHRALDVQRRGTDERHQRRHQGRQPEPLAAAAFLQPL
ncbi:hypothetical protein D3C81_959230 [compost metagenome]